MELISKRLQSRPRARRRGGRRALLGHPMGSDYQPESFFADNGRDSSCLRLREGNFRRVELFGLVTAAVGPGREEYALDGRQAVGIPVLITQIGRTRRFITPRGRYLCCRRTP